MDVYHLSIWSDGWMQRWEGHEKQTIKKHKQSISLFEITQFWEINSEFQETRKMTLHKEFDWQAIWPIITA